MSQTITKVWLLVILILSGCVPPQVAKQPKQEIPTNSYVPVEIPTFSQDQEVMLLSPLKLKIEKAYWTDNVGPEKPDANFLVVEISLTNTAKKAILMTMPYGVKLKNEQDVEYLTSRFVGYLTSRNPFIMGSSWIGAGVGELNPNMTRKQRILFDVPKDSYFSVVYDSDTVTPLFRWKLSPIEMEKK